MWKKCLCIGLIALMPLGFCGCSGKPKQTLKPGTTEPSDSGGKADRGADAEAPAPQQ